MNNTYTRSSKTKYHTKQENLQFYGARREFLKHPAALLLDSSLIFQTNYKKVTHKIIKIGDYYQIYDYKTTKLKKDKNIEKIKFENRPIKGIKTDYKLDMKYAEEYSKFYSNPMYIQKGREDIRLKHIDIPVEIKKEKTIDIKNINRARFELQRIVKANEKEFKTFVTLTFEENITDIEKANKMFNSFRTYIKRLKNDFKYVCVPEFQKRGAVHYHLLTNIDYNDIQLLSQEEKKLWNKSSKQWQVGKNIKAWNKGYTLVKKIDNYNIIGYISKYMTKDIDNRLWGKRRYLCSQNLIKPKISYIDIDDIEDFAKLVDITAGLTVTYKTTYKNVFNEEIEFLEYRKEPSNE